MKKSEYERVSLILETLSSESYFTLNKKLLIRFGPEAAIFITNLIDKYRYFLSRHMLEPDGRFFLTHEDQEGQTGINVRGLRKCKKIFTDLGIIETELKGVPPKEFYHIHLDALYEEISGVPLPKTQRFECRRVNGYENDRVNGSNVEGIYKENVYKEPKEKILPPSRMRSFIFRSWNELAKKCNLRPIQKLSSSRKTHLDARIKEYPKKSEWQEIFKSIEESDFLAGDNDKEWKIFFDWLIENDNKIPKILEGTYKNKSNGRGRTRKGGATVESRDKYKSGQTVEIRRTGHA